MFNPLNLISKIIKGSNQKELDRIQKIVKNINLLEKDVEKLNEEEFPKKTCLLYTSPSPRDKRQSRMPSSA